ncbi:MAG: hypothetical protein K0Q60_3773 [Microvirga sp.]|jgi:hypothetical protein|nr:hypothetical protein [Microvirga sp.]
MQWARGAASNPRRRPGNRGAVRGLRSGPGERGVDSAPRHVRMGPSRGALALRTSCTGECAGCQCRMIPAGPERPGEKKRAAGAAPYSSPSRPPSHQAIGRLLRSGAKVCPAISEAPP